MEDKFKVIVEKGVTFNSYGFSIKERKVGDSEIIFAFVPNGIVEIASNNNKEGITLR